jgi:hypothetical protein
MTDHHERKIVNTELIRIPVQPSPYGYRPLARYDYRTRDSRWLVRKQGHCGGPAWSVTDTTGEVFSTGPHGRNAYATIARTLRAAKAFISEWSA